MSSITSTPNQGKARGWTGWRDESASTVAKYESLLNAVSAEPKSELARLLNANAPEQIITRQIFIEAEAAMVSNKISPGLLWMKEQMDEQSGLRVEEYAQGSTEAAETNNKLGETYDRESFLSGALDVCQAALQGDFATATKVAKEHPGMEVHTSD